MQPSLKYALFFGLFLTTGLLAHRSILTFIQEYKIATNGSRKTEESNETLNSDSVENSTSNEVESEPSVSSHEPHSEENQEPMIASNPVDEKETHLILETDEMPHHVPMPNVQTIESEEPMSFLKVATVGEEKTILDPMPNVLAVASEGLAADTLENNETLDASFLPSFDNATQNLLNTHLHSEHNHLDENGNQDRWVETLSPPMSGVDPIFQITSNGIPLDNTHFKTKESISTSDFPFSHHADLYSPPAYSHSTLESTPPSKLKQKSISDPFATLDSPTHGSEWESFLDKRPSSENEIHESLLRDLVEVEQGRGEDHPLFSESFPMSETPTYLSQPPESMDENKKSASLNLAAPEFIPQTLVSKVMGVGDPKAEKNPDMELKSSRCHFWPECKFNTECVYWHPIHLCPNENVAGFEPKDCPYGSRCVFYHHHELKYLESIKAHPLFPRSKGLVPPNYKFLGLSSSTFDMNELEDDPSDTYSDATDSHLLSDFSFQSNISSKSSNILYNVYMGGGPSIDVEDLHLDDVDDDNDDDPIHLDLDAHDPSNPPTESISSKNDSQIDTTIRSGPPLNINAPMFLPRFLEKP